MSGLHFPWVACPVCDGTNVYDNAADDSPTFELMCRDCGHEWQTQGFGFEVFKSSDAVEGNR